MGVPHMDPLANLSLPPGFRFYPTDEELMVQYLCRKVAGHQFPLPIIGDIDLYKFDPWDLPSKALFGEKEWYFFSPRERKYPNGSRPNRVAGSGYWKATGTDKVIKTQGRTVGIKKALVFYTGKAPKGAKTNWIMHEFRLSQSATTTRPGSSRLDDWVLCRIYRKSSSAAKPTSSAMSGEHSTGGSSSTASSTQFDDVLDSIPEIDGRLIGYPEQESQRFGIQSFGSGNLDWAALAGLTNGPIIGPIGISQAQLQSELLPPLRHVDSPQEVQSGIRAQRVNPLEGFMGYSDPLDPFGIRYPAPMEGFGFGQ